MLTSVAQLAKLCCLTFSLRFQPKGNTFCLNIGKLQSDTKYINYIFYKWYIQ